MKNIKKIKILSPSKLSLASKDDFMAKLKPTLGQNQINLVTFVNELNKKTTFLSDQNMVELSVQILRKIDKTFSIEISLPGASLFKHQFAVLGQSGDLPASVLQDMLLIRETFGRHSGQPTEKLSRPQLARILLSNFEALKTKIINGPSS